MKANQEEQSIFANFVTLRPNAIPRAAWAIPPDLLAYESIVITRSSNKMNRQ